MKKFKLVVALVALTFTTLSFASEKNPVAKKELRTQIVSILGDSVEKVGEDIVEAEVSFTLNDKSEIVILSVKSDNEQVERIVKGRLNYKKVDVKAVNEGKIYRMPLKIVNK